MPILVCTVIAYSVAGLFTISLYDMMLEINDLPYLPRVRDAEVYRLRARDTMHVTFPFLSLHSTGADALALISKKQSALEDAGTIAQYPLVDAPDTMTLIGSVARDDLEVAWARVVLLSMHVSMCECCVRVCVCVCARVCVFAVDWRT